MELIASDQNSLVKLARKLSISSHERKKTGKTLLDGVHLIDAYASHFGLENTQVLVSESMQRSGEIQALLARWRPARVALLREPLFRKISTVETPSGIAAVINIPLLSADRARTGSWLLLEGIQDPGNLGSILRTAAATGISRALLSKTCSDHWSPKCLRGGMGAQFVLPCESADLPSVLESFPGKCIATAPRAGVSLTDVDLTGDVALLFGAEGGGLDPDLQRRADVLVHIPLAAGIESLNVGAAVAMCCYERLRQAVRRH